MTAHERLMQELVATMAANARTPLPEIKVTVSAMDLDAELGALRVLRAISSRDDGLRIEAEHLRRVLQVARPYISDKAGAGIIGAIDAALQGSDRHG